MTSVVYAAGADRTAAVVGEVSRSGVRLARAVPVTRTRFDIFDGRLHARGLRLELRTVGVSRELVLTGGKQPPAILGLSGAIDSTQAIDPTALLPGPLSSRIRRGCRCTSTRISSAPTVLAPT